MKYILLLSTIILLSCNKSSIMSEPLQAIPKATVNGKVVTLTADQSTGDVCAYGWQLSEGSVQGGTASFSPSSSFQGEKNPNRNNSGEPYYVSGTLQYHEITATVNKTGTYKFSLQVLDAFQKESWADINVEVK